MYKNGTVAAVILAAGSSTRFGGGRAKQWCLLHGKSVLYHTLKAFDDAPSIDRICLVIRKEDAACASELTEHVNKPVTLCIGADDRQTSARNGVRSLEDDVAYIAIHDGARCLVTPQLIEKTVEKAKQYGAACAVEAAVDTVKCVDACGNIVKTQDRTHLCMAQTPQVFARDLYEKALDHAQASGVKVTDDCALLEAIGVPIGTVFHNEDNFKVTYPKDMRHAAYILSQREGGTMKTVIGHGYDVHRLVKERPLILGGVHVPHTHGLLGHSDADVLLHAVMDALLGAVGEGDIGRHFPDNDPAYSGISSMNLLAKVANILQQKGAQVANMDATLILQKPKVAPYLLQMKENIARVLGCDVACINIKATTEEHLGFTGREEGVAAHAVCLLTLSV